MTTAIQPNTDQMDRSNCVDQAVTFFAGKTSGPYLMFKGVDNAIKLIQVVNANCSSHLSKMGDIAKHGQTALGIPYALYVGRTVVKDAWAFQEQGADSSLRQKGRFGMNVVDFASAASYAFVAPFVALGSKIGKCCGFLKDSVEAIWTVRELHAGRVWRKKYADEDGSSEMVNQAYRDTQVLNWMGLAKAVTSAVAGLFGVLALAGVVTIDPVIAVGLIVIGLATATLSIASEFYKRSMEYQPVPFSW